MQRRAFGTDRLNIGEDGALRLSSLRPKEGWTPRRVADQIRRDFPGTCIRWDDEYFEVVSVESLPAGVRYTLQPWSDSHTMRTILDYDEQSEIRREQERRADRARRAKAAGFNAGAIVTGLLPAPVQEELARDVGISAARVTLVSCIIPFSVGFLALLTFLAAGFGAAMSRSNAGMEPFVLLPLVYFFVESLVRASVAMAQDKPMGSLPVVLVWEVIAVIRGKRPIRTPQPKLKWEIDQTLLDRDAFTQREPFLALLSPDEQRQLEARYGFDWTGRGRSSAHVLLLIAVFVIAVNVPDLVRSRAGAGDFLSMLFMGYLVWEQITRLRRIRGGEPAGSVLGALVRPVSRKLFDDGGAAGTG